MKSLVARSSNPLQIQLDAISYNFVEFYCFRKLDQTGYKKCLRIAGRVKAAGKMIKKAGGKMQFFTTMGKDDFVLLVEIAKDEDMTAILLCTGSMGNIRTIKTHRHEIT